MFSEVYGLSDPNGPNNLTSMATRVAYRGKAQPLHSHAEPMVPLLGGFLPSKVSVKLGKRGHRNILRKYEEKIDLNRKGVLEGSPHNAPSNYYRSFSTRSCSTVILILHRLPYTSIVLWL